MFDRESRRAVPPPGLADLSEVKRFRNYLGVSAVGPVAHHFTVWYHNIEPNMVRVRVQRGAAGHLVLEPEGGYWGGLGVAPHTVQPMPPEVAALAGDLEAELRSRCPSAGHWKIAYGGLNRTVTAQEFIAHDDRSGTRRAGWYAKVQLAVDESLTQVVDVVEQWSAFGQIEAPTSTQWIAVPPSETGRLSLGGRDLQKLAAPITEAARLHDARQPAPALASLVPADDSMLPPGFISRVTAKVTLYVRGTSADRDLIAALDLRDAVFGASATAEAVLTLDHRVYRLHATLTPATPRAPTPGRTHDKYAGTLGLRLEDDRDHVWEHSYPATGNIEMDGDTVIAPFGLEIPGASSPSLAYDERRGQLAGGTPSGGAKFVVDVSLFDDPRR